MSKIKMNKNKQDEIELKETTYNNLIHLTIEENRKIIPREVEKLKYILNNNTQITKYSWEINGEKIINSHKVYFTKEEKKILKSLLLKKIPEKLRPDFWLIASGARREIMNNKNYYKNLAENFPECIPSPYENQIDMDLHRTFPGDVYFQKEENLKKLKNILVAYSRRNISIGYCQGFNFIAGRLLKIYNNEEEAFWVFVQLIENILPLNYYSELAGIMIDCSILMKLIKNLLPTLYYHLIDVGYELSLNNVLYKWFVSLFIQNLSHELSLIVWDLIFLEGNIIMFKSALGILKIIKKNVLSKESLEDINEAFDEGTRHLNDHQSLIYYLVARKFEFDLNYICRNRQNFQTAIIENIQKNNENKMTNEYSTTRRVSYFQNVVDCFLEWPICIYDSSYKYSIVNFLVFRVFDPINIIEDYYPEPKKRKKSEWHYILTEHSSEMEDEPIKRKSSKSIEGFHKINLNDSANANYGMLSLTDFTNSNSNTNPNSPKGKNNTSYDYKFSLYNNLLVERRKHFCPPKEKIAKSDEDPQVFINGDFKVQDSYVKIIKEEAKVNKADKSDSAFNAMLSIFDSKVNKSNKSIKSRSHSMMKSSFLMLQSNLKDDIIFNHDLDEINDINIKILESLKQKPLLDLEEFVLEKKEKN